MSKNGVGFVDVSFCSCPFFPERALFCCCPLPILEDAPSPLHYATVHTKKKWCNYAPLGVQTDGTIAAPLGVKSCTL